MKPWMLLLLAAGGVVVAGVLLHFATRGTPDFGLDTPADSSGGGSGSNVTFKSVYNNTLWTAREKNYVTNLEGEGKQDAFY